MSVENQEYTEHSLWHHERFNKNCEWCAHERQPRPKKLNYEAVGSKLKVMAHNMEKVGDIVKVLDDAKKNNPRGLIF